VRWINLSVIKLTPERALSIFCGLRAIYKLGAGVGTRLVISFTSIISSKYAD
jgi:hypothetical protein